MTQNLTHEAKTFGDWAYLAVAKHFKKILKHEEGVLKDQDPEDLHQMRVGMRRLRSVIVGFSPALKLPKNAHEKRVGKVAQILGTLRDIDVLDEALKNSYQSTLPPTEQKPLDQALAVLAEQRTEAFNQVKDILNHKFYLKLKKAFQNWLDAPTYQEIAEISIDNILPDLLLPQVSKLILHPGWLVGVKFTAGEPQFSDGLGKKEVEALLARQGYILHDLRKEAKRSRYNMELFMQFYGDAYENYVTDIKAIQTVLGEIQDCFVLTEFLGSVFKNDLAEEMPNLTNQITETRYKKWQEWEELQHKFLNLETRKDFHLTIFNHN